MYYSGGQVSFFYNVDPDKMSYFELKGMVEDLGYNNVAKLFYLCPNKSMETGLRIIVNDKDIGPMLKTAKLTCGIEVYVEHSVGVDKDKGNGVGEGHVECVEKGNDDHQDNDSDRTESEVDVRYEDNSEESDANSLEFVSDDEELIQARKNILRKKGKLHDDASGVTENVGGASVEQSAEGTTKASIGVENRVDIETDISEGNVEASSLRVENRVGNKTDIAEIEELEKGYETGDVDSDECPSPDSSDREGGVRVRQKFPVFNPNTEMKNIEIVKGMKFANCEELKSALRNFSVVKGYPIRFERNSVASPQLQEWNEVHDFAITLFIPRSSNFNP
ncbi:hypothetical protein LguiB_029960 [Lonicera macranthoides]